MMPGKPSISQRRQHVKQLAFLSHFEKSGNVLASAKRTGISRQLVYYWRNSSPSFAKKLSTATEIAFKDSMLALPLGNHGAN
ncbi:MAG: hypothetical protein WCO60_15390 [Verrucomicrobiota bacterium]